MIVHGSITAPKEQNIRGNPSHPLCKELLRQRDSLIILIRNKIRRERKSSYTMTEKNMRARRATWYVRWAILMVTYIETDSQVGIRLTEMSWDTTKKEI